ncbi:hypothetical protein Tco_0019995 [Tanacetum coccineum]
MCQRRCSSLHGLVKLQTSQILTGPEYYLAPSVARAEPSPNLTPRSGSIEDMVPHPQLALSPQDAQASECTLVHDPQVHTLENVVPAPTTIGQPPRKDPQMEYSKIVALRTPEQRRIW